MDFDLDLEELEPMYGGAADTDKCGNCGRVVAELYHVPEFDYMGCDDCMEEALNVIASEAAGMATPADRQVLAAARIRTSCIYPPIPSREYDWSAWVDGHEESRSGYGPTREAAIFDLIEQLKEVA
jgi:hypothetical protein